MWVSVYATRDLQTGEEVFLSYGYDYWAEHAEKITNSRPAHTGTVNKTPPKSLQTIIMKYFQLQQATHTLTKSTSHEPNITKSANWAAPSYITSSINEIELTPPTRDVPLTEH